MEMSPLDELWTARDELVLLMATLDPAGARQAAGVLARVERAIEILKGEPPKA